MPLRIRDDRRPRAAVPATGATSVGGRSPLNHHRTLWLAVAAPWLVVLTPAVDAQVSTATKAAQGVQAGTLVIEPRAELYGTTYRLANVMTCVGNASDPKAYGVKWSGLDGRATHTSIPIGGQVHVTVASTGKKGFGSLQGQRVNYVLKSSGLTLPIDMPRTKQPGPTCETAIGMEPAPVPSKSLPQEETTVPLLDGTLKASPSVPVNNPVVTLYTVASSPLRLEVAGVPTHWQVTTSPNPPAANTLFWYPVTIDGWGLIRAVNVSLIKQGKQTLYLYLKNALGVSAGAPVEVTFVDTRPCTFTWKRWSGPIFQSGSTTTTETISVARGSSKGFAGDGMNIGSWKNTGPHPVVIGYTVGEHNTTNQHQGVKADTLPPGFEGAHASYYPFAHAKYANCP